MMTMLGEALVKVVNTNSRVRSNSDPAKMTQASTTEALPFSVTKNTQLAPLEHLMHIITNNERTMNFFASMPSFTYQHERYTDWIDEILNAATLISATVTGDDALTMKQKD